MDLLLGTSEFVFFEVIHSQKLQFDCRMHPKTQSLSFEAYKGGPMTILQFALERIVTLCEI